MATNIALVVLLVTIHAHYWYSSSEVFTSLVAHTAELIPFSITKPTRSIATLPGLDSLRVGLNCDGLSLGSILTHYNRQISSSLKFVLRGPFNSDLTGY